MWAIFRACGHGSERRSVAARRDAREEVDLLRRLHPAQLLDVGVGAGVLVRLDRLDLALPEETALGVDLLRGEDVPLVHGLAQDGGGARVEGHVADLVGRGRNRALGLRRRRLGLGLADEARPADQGHSGGGGADRQADLTQEIATGNFWSHIASLLRWADGFEAIGVLRTMKYQDISRGWSPVTRVK